VVIKVCVDINEFEVALCLFGAMSDDVPESSLTESSKNILKKDVLSIRILLLPLNLAKDICQRFFELVGRFLGIQAATTP
jgi:hypothetical protein